MPKMNKNSPEVFVIFFHAMVEFFDVRLGEKTQNPFFKLSGTLAGDDFHRTYPFS